MIDKRPSSVKVRRECFEAHKRLDENGRYYLTCHICEGRIDPVRDIWEAEHVLPHAFGGRETKPAHERCHKTKTAEEDIPAIAKSKRVFEKHYGIRRKSGWGGKWKKKISGEVVAK